MQQKFRLFVQRHDNGTYTVTVPGISDIPYSGDWDEEGGPLASSLSAHGLILDEVKDDVRQALAKWLAKADARALNHFDNYKEDQSLEKVEVELRPEDRAGRKRHNKIQMVFSLLLGKEKDDQYLVHVPKLTSPPLSFYCYNLHELAQTASQELTAYFKDSTLEEMLPYRYQRQEMLDWIEVSFTPQKPQAERKKTKEEQDDANFWALKASGINLSARVREGRLHRAYRRDRIIEQMLRLLAADRNSSILLSGASGVGKTAIVHEIARRIREDQCPAALRERQVWYTSPGQLIAGCMYVGQWEEKLKNVIAECRKKRHILLMDDVIGLMEEGKSAKSDGNMAEFLKPYLADGTVTLIGESSPERVRTGENRDPGFLRLFTPIVVPETNADETLSILGSVGATLEREFGVRIEPGAQEAALELTRRYQPYRAFPGKALALVEQVAQEMGKRTDAEEREKEEKRPVISRQVIVRAFSTLSGLPEFLLSDHLPLEPDAVEQHFRERLIGQPDAVQTVVDLVTVLKAGLNDPGKPLGVLFFVGPTGVGKTEMAKTLAAYLFGSQERILRYDMSEFADAYSVAKLIGSPLGDQEGELTKRIRLQPFSVVLLDEFEKADASIFDALLQVLGEGRLTDAAGRTADFRSAIILMTSNLGASPRDQRKPGLREADAHRALETHFTAQVEKFFRPEFVNRLDKIVVFRPLDRDAMRLIAQREIAKLLEREGVTRRGLLVEMDDGMMDLLLETGFSPVYGARPLKREIEKRIIVPLARFLVAQRSAGAQLVQIRSEGGEVRIVASPLTDAKQVVRQKPGLLQHGEGTRRLDIKELIEGFAAVRLHLHEWSESDRVRALQTEHQNLLARTRRRNFVAYGVEAHKVWERVYHLERLTKRLNQLKERSEYLEEFATMTQRERSGRYETDLATSYAELCRDADYLEIELLCADQKDNNQALLRLLPLGKTAKPAPQAAWLLTLAKMYLRWASRKGYTVAVYAPVEPYHRHIVAEGLTPKSVIPGFDPGPPLRPPYVEITAGDFTALLKKLETLQLPEIVLGLKGANVSGFLRGETGAHKLLIRADDTDPSAPFQTATVTVSPLADDDSPLAHLTLEWEAEQKRKAEAAAKGAKLTGSGVSETPPEIIRLYAPDGSRFVRDLRTEVQTTQVAGVFEGQLDDFILAYLKANLATEEE